MNLRERISEIVQNFTSREIVGQWNIYCEEHNYMDDWIYSMSEFDEIEAGKSPWDIARDCFYGRHFNPSDDYFWFNGYANLESSDCPEFDNNSPIDMGTLIDAITDEIDEPWCEEIKGLLELEDEDKKEDE